MSGGNSRFYRPLRFWPAEAARVRRKSVFNKIRFLLDWLVCHRHALGAARGAKPWAPTCSQRWSPVLDIKELKSFCMVVKLGSFSKASKALVLGQPAVSKHIQRLEAELGRPLLERGARPLKLTAAGSNLYRMAEPFVEGLATLDSRSPLAMSSPITVAVPHGFIGYVLPEAARDLRDTVPSARIRVLSGTKEEVFELVQTGGADFAVAPDPGASRRFDFTPLYPSERVLITPGDHPLLAQRPTSLKDVAKYPLILPRFQTQTRALLESEFRRLRISYDIAVELDSIELLERYVELGLGLGVGLRGAAGMESWVRLGIVSLAPFLPSEMIGVVRSRALPLSQPATALIARIQDLARAMPAATPASRGRRR
ncbi:LysR family transcriptional regulator [Pollutimonas sp. M17]|uniref:LysR family transcriptional regulator n=1 Tax=Pollutimonas sp. M17 TaxID=2962065 RepID=UPI0021F4C6D2|nr:LysR family transcriptional regulator [Pollutimonas sp. M17]UYO93863.1 LysR family transcriptional regulator [Pollutimonas sp. M17]